MKKIIYIMLGIVSIILGFGIISEFNKQNSIGIIGGADGPTAIFIAGKVSYEPFLVLIVIGLILLAGIIIIMKKRK